MLSDSMSGSIEGTIRGSIGRTLVSHNNTSSSNGRGYNNRSAQAGNKGIGLGYTTVSAEEGPSGVSYIGGQRRTVSPPRDIGSSNPMLKDGGKGSSDMRFSINDEDDDGEELEII
jgi:hypothetical protein